jgi:hypothetical protein
MLSVSKRDGTIPVHSNLGALYFDGSVIWT